MSVRRQLHGRKSHLDSGSNGPIKNPRLPDIHIHRVVPDRALPGTLRLAPGPQATFWRRKKSETAAFRRGDNDSADCLQSVVVTARFCEQCWLVLQVVDLQSEHAAVCQQFSETPRSVAEALAKVETVMRGTICLQ